MPIEFEAKFLDIDVKALRHKLKEIGATEVHPMKKYIRSVYYMCDPKIQGYMRIRDEGGKVFITSKNYAKNKDFPEEHEIAIEEDFNKAMQLFDSIGMTKKAFQESYREKWKHELAHEITFDTVPGLPTYMEVDCETEEKLNKMIDLLKLDKAKMRHGAFDRTYNEYYDIDRDVINNQTPFLTFKNILNEIKPKKNKELLIKLATEQKELGISLKQHFNHYPKLIYRLVKLKGRRMGQKSDSRLFAF